MMLLDNSPGIVLILVFTFAITVVAIYFVERFISFQIARRKYKESVRKRKIYLKPVLKFVTKFNKKYILGDYQLANSNCIVEIKRIDHIKHVICYNKDKDCNQNNCFIVEFIKPTTLYNKDKIPFPIEAMDDVFDLICTFFDETTTYEDILQRLYLKCFELKFESKMPTFIEQLQQKNL